MPYWRVFYLVISVPSPLYGEVKYDNTDLGTRSTLIVGNLGASC